MVTLANPSVRQINRYVNDYDTALKFLGSRYERKLANNTVVRRDSQYTPGPSGSRLTSEGAKETLPNIQIILHRTPIVTYYPDGRVMLNSGGYHTVTTKQRMNQLLPPGFGVEQKNYNWYVRAPDGSKEDFFDGIILKGPISEAAKETLLSLSRQMSPPKYPGHQPNPRKRSNAHDPADKREKSYKYGDTTYYLEKVPFSGHWLVKAGGHALGAPQPSYGIALANFYAVTGREGQPWVDVWEERDNLQITLYFGEKDDPNESEEIATWSDEDAREMFTDGFFKSGKHLKASVITYAEEVGLL